VAAYGKTCCYARFQTTEPQRRPWAPLPEGLAEVLERCPEQEREHRQPDFGPVLAVRAARDPAEEAAGRRREEGRRRPGAEARRGEQEQPRPRGGRRGCEEMKRRVTGSSAAATFRSPFSTGWPRVGSVPGQRQPPEACRRHHGSSVWRRRKGGAWPRTR